MTIRFTASARQQFLSGLAYIRGDDALAAARFRQRAEQILRRLIAHPQSGRRVPEFPDLPHREVIVAPYRFFYRIESQTIWIIAVWHGAQSPRKPPESAPALEPTSGGPGRRRRGRGVRRRRS